MNLTQIFIKGAVKTAGGLGVLSLIALGYRLYNMSYNLYSNSYKNVSYNSDNKSIQTEEGDDEGDRFKVLFD